MLQTAKTQLSVFYRGLTQVQAYKLSQSFYTTIFIMVKHTIVSEVNHPGDRRSAISDPGLFWRHRLAMVCPDRA